MTVYRLCLVSALALGTALLGACAGGRDAGLVTVLQPELVQPSLNRAEQHEAEGNWLAAAHSWQEIASQQTSPQREDSLLRALELLLWVEAFDEAQQLIGLIQPTQVEQRVRLRLALAELALARQQPNTAFEILNALSPFGPTQKRRQMQLRADAYQQTGQHYEAAQERIALDPLLDPAQREQNHLRIWEALNLLGVATLEALQATAADTNLRGWLELAYLSKQAAPGVQSQRAQIATWRQRYPQHPAGQTLLLTLEKLAQTPVPQTGQIALLLPLEDKFREAARAVRDGFFTAYYTDPQHAQTRIHVYATTPENVNQQYEQAMQDGAQIVVGPLNKDALLNLLTRPAFPVPVLALNDVPGYNSPANLYYFALSPEDEARQVAEHIWLDGHSRGVALYPEGAWGKRIFDAFQERWQQLGGELIDGIAFNNTGKDLATPIRTLLDIDESYQRHRRVENTMVQNLKFEMRRRQDIEFVFFAANPTLARQLRPQFDFFNATGVPLYTTSHVYTGKPDRRADRDMDGVVFGDMPWTLKSDTPLRDRVQNLWAEQRQAYTRLFAFGIDAYRLLPQLDRLSRYRFTRLAGATGSLHIDETARVRRELSWAIFRAGTPRLVEPQAVLPSEDDELPVTRPAEPASPPRFEPVNESG
jgi:outer membrane PBP1 activator LpoA protein